VAIKIYSRIISVSAHYTGKLEQPGNNDRKTGVTGMSKSNDGNKRCVSNLTAQATLRPWAMGNKSPIEQRNNLELLLIFFRSPRFAYYFSILYVPNNLIH
jgi:hypothetical protein